MLNNKIGKLEDSITIFTPTYNRGYIIKNCYESLCRQNNKNFTWLIVDDGSTDNTEKLIESFIQDKKIKINYIKQDNSGKHVAHNTAVRACETEVFVCVDSDDYLSDDAVQTLYNEWDYIKNDDELAGVIGLRGESVTQPIGTWMPEDIEKSSIFNLYAKYKFKGDTIIAFKTSILKEFQFPIFENEKFVTEAVIYDKISQRYKMKLLNKVLYICEYLNDGYTRNIYSIHKKNPNGYIYFLNQRIHMAKGFSATCLAVSYYFAGCLQINNMSYYKKYDNKLIKIIAIPRGIWIYVKPFIKNKLKKYISGK
ncbi:MULTISPECIES: glycosyltransferase family A protein [Bacillus]|uniref:glycosyltransferase family A protein n=1 Tax=Bacillus TaxID=1386 RepID=UPI0020909753|nr:MULTISPECIES: glycosyltransferase family 2 protein [Bacillus]